jgi:hypothetical protein
LFIATGSDQFGKPQSKRFRQKRCDRLYYLRDETACTDRRVCHTKALLVRSPVWDICIKLTAISANMPVNIGKTDNLGIFSPTGRFSESA